MENLKIVSSGLTKSLRPNIIVSDLEKGIEYHLWYHSTFFRVNDALEYLKDIYKEGIEFKDIGVFWLRLEDIEDEL